MAAACGHTQSLHTNSLDEAIALPTDFSARIARNTQLFLQEETALCKVIDPWAGSFFVESLTQALLARAQAHLQEIESLGGMAKAIETGLPKLRIEGSRRPPPGPDRFRPRSRHRRQHLPPRKRRGPRNPRSRQHRRPRFAIKRLQSVKAARNQAAVDAALAALTQAAQSASGNLLALAVDAARARATLGEISLALEKVFHRHKAVIRSVSGVYRAEYSGDLEPRPGPPAGR